MVIRFFARNPILYFKQIGSPKSQVRCTGHFSFLARIILNYHFTRIIAYIHLIKFKINQKFTAAQKFL